MYCTNLCFSVFIIGILKILFEKGYNNLTPVTVNISSSICNSIPKEIRYPKILNNIKGCILKNNINMAGKIRECVKLLCSIFLKNFLLRI